MGDFPRTTVGGVSVSRMIIGTNWFLGFSHCTRAKGQILRRMFKDYKAIADIIEVFLKGGVDTLMGPFWDDHMPEAIKEAEDRTGVKAIVVWTPKFETNERTPVDGFDMGEVNRVLEKGAEIGATFCLPHTSTVDVMVDKCTQELRKVDQLCAAIREHDMIPGLSTHVPEAILYADETDLDVETYISIFNSMGFLMPIEVDWVQRLIQKAKKPVMTIKPMAAGQIRPLQAMTFAWNAIRDQDMITVGTMSPGEAQELIDLSLSIIENRAPQIDLQATRSKASLASLAK